MTTDSHPAHHMGYAVYLRKGCGGFGGGVKVLSIAGSGTACEPFNTVNVLGGQVVLERSSPRTV